MYYKITNRTENHRGFQYIDGLNILLEEKFCEDPSKSCCEGGLYFTDAKNIFKFLQYGIYLREVILPLDNPNFKMVADKSGDKWRANMIILGKKLNLFEVTTFKYLIDLGADIHVDNDLALRLTAEKGYSDIVRFLVELGADVCAEDNYALIWSTKNRHLDLAKYLVNQGSDICARSNALLIWSIQSGKLELVKWIVQLGADIHANDDSALKWCAKFGYVDIAKYLVQL